MKLLLGTNNAGKIIEMREMLSGLPIEIATLKDAGIVSDVHEHGTTYSENALIKARHFHELSGLSTVADDSGIIVDALKDELGIQTRRWGAGPQASDKEWIEYFLKRMEKERNRKATFVCCLALIDSEGKETIFEGRCEGEITQTLEADYLPGLPISACFKPKGFGAVYAAMKIEQKNSTSHRGKALKLLHDYLKTEQA